jgi:hypothetical protein
LSSTDDAAPVELSTMTSTEILSRATDHLLPSRAERETTTAAKIGDAQDEPQHENVSEVNFRSPSAMT